MDQTPRQRDAIEEFLPLDIRSEESIRSLEILAGIFQETSFEIIDLREEDRDAAVERFLGNVEAFQDLLVRFDRGPIRRALDALPPDEAARSLNELNIGKTLNRAHRFASHILLPVAKRDGWKNLEAIREAILRLDRLYEEVLYPDIELRSQLPREEVARILKEVPAHLEDLAMRIDPQQRTANLRDVLKLLHTASELHDGDTGADSMRVGVINADLWEMHILDLALESPRDCMNDIITSHDKAGILPLARIHGEIRSHHACFRSAVAGMKRDVRRTWGELPALEEAETTALRAERQNANAEAEHYRKLLLSPPREKGKEHRSQLLVWIQEDLAKLEKEVGFNDDDADVIAAKQRQMRELRNLIPRVLREDFDLRELGTKRLLNYCPQYLDFDVQRREIDAILGMRESDPTRHSLALRHRHIERRREELEADAKESVRRTLGGIIPHVKARKFAAGLLHDLGKLSVPQELLQSDRIMTAEDFEYTKYHPFYGMYILSAAFGKELSNVPLFHHRTYDGNDSKRYVIERYHGAAVGKNIPSGGQHGQGADSWQAIKKKRKYRHKHQIYNEREMSHLAAAEVRNSSPLSEGKDTHKNNQFSPKTARYLLLRHERGDDALLTDSELKRRVQEYEGMLNEEVDISEGVLLMLFRMLAVRSPDRAIQAFKTSQFITCLYDTLQREEPDHPAWKEIDAECGQFGITRDTWIATVGLAVMFYHVGHVRMSEDLDTAKLTLENREYGEIRRKQVEATFEILSKIGKNGPFRAVKTHALFQHATRGGYFPSDAILQSLGYELPEGAVHSRGGAALLAATSYAHTFDRDHLADPTAASIHMRTINLLAELKSGAPKYDPALLGMLEWYARKSSSAVAELRRLVPETERRDFHQYTVDEHMRRVEEGADPARIVEHVERVKRMEKRGSLTLDEREDLVDIFSGVARLMDQSERFRLVVEEGLRQHDIGKLLEQTRLHNARLNLAAATEADMGSAQCHESIGKRYLRDVVFDGHPVDRSDFTTYKAKFRPENRPTEQDVLHPVPEHFGELISEPLLRRRMEKVEDFRDMTELPDELKRVAIEYVASHHIALDVLKFARERARELLPEELRRRHEHAVDVLTADLLELATSGLVDEATLAEHYADLPLANELAASCARIRFRFETHADYLASRANIYCATREGIDSVLEHGEPIAPRDLLRSFLFVWFLDGSAKNDAMEELGETGPYYRLALRLIRAAESRITLPLPGGQRGGAEQRIEQPAEERPA